MRWEALFDDLEGQLEAAERAELASEVRDRSRREAGLVSAFDRMRAAPGATLDLTVEGSGPLSGRLLQAGSDWLLLEEARARDLLVAMSAVLGVSGLGRRAAPPGSEGSVGRRLDLRWALRGLTRDRANVRLVLRDGSVLSGTLDRVGSDHVDLAMHAQGEERRAGSVQGVRLVPLRALALVRTG